MPEIQWIRRAGGGPVVKAQEEPQAEPPVEIAEPETEIEPVKVKAKKGRKK